MHEHNHQRIESKTHSSELLEQLLLLIKSIAKTENDNDLKIKKRIITFETVGLLCYAVCLPFFNPRLTVIDSTMIILINLIQLVFVLTRKTYLFLATHFLIITLMVGGFSQDHHDYLRALGVFLIQRNYFFLLPSSKLLKITNILSTLFIMSTMQRKVAILIEEGNIMKLIEAIESFQCEWLLVYLFNNFSAMHVVGEYCIAFKKTENAQEHLAKANDTLIATNKKLETTLSLLETTNKGLSEAIKSRELFIASFSHELRNPLNSLMGNIDLLVMDVKNGKWLKMLDTCKICGEVLLGLINNVLDVAKINAEKVELNYQSTNFFGLLEKVWKVSTGKMRQKGLKGYLEISNSVPNFIRTDSHRLNQILLNLIGNATKFTKSGFVKVIVSCTQNDELKKLQRPSQSFCSLRKARGLLEKNMSLFKPERRPKLRGDSLMSNYSVEENDTSLLINLDVIQRRLNMRSMHPDYTVFSEFDTKIVSRMVINSQSRGNFNGIIEIEVVDTGCGITNFVIDRLFKPFSQADSSVTRKYGGTGLGLYITKELIEKMNGKIDVHSQENTGSSFRLFIPIQITEQMDTQALRHKSEATINTSFNDRPRVLVVDDDPLNQVIMRSYFNKLSIKVDVATNGQEAVEAFISARPDYYSLITMDIQMPVMDGLTACKEIRRYENQEPRRRNAPIIIVTGNCTDVETNQGLDPNGEIKASYLFRKPFTFEECESCVQTLISL